MNKYLQELILILFVNINLQAQKPLVDTTHFHQLITSERLLIKEWVLKIKSAKSDSFKIELIQEMYMQMNDNDVWILYTDLMEKHIDLYLKAKGKNKFYLEKLYGYYNDKAYYANYKNDFDSKYFFNEKALETATELGDKSKLVFHLNNDAMYFYQLGNFDIAVKKIHQALKLFNELGDFDSKITLQFGGSIGKKFMYKPFKKSLLSIQNVSMDEQKSILEKQFEDWKGNNEQIDDVCIIGVRI